MIPQPLRVRDTHLFTYAIASAEMRYITISERQVYLRDDPAVGPIVRGEIEECGPGCFANLSQVLLEYALSCEGCQEQEKAFELVECVSTRLGAILAAKLSHAAPDLPDVDRVAGGMQFLLRSMGATFEMKQTPARLHFTLTADPLYTAAHELSLTRSLPAALHGFVTLCSSMLHALAPGWTLAQPLVSGTEQPLLEIILQSE